MQSVTIAPDALAQIKALRVKQQQNAHGLGVLVWEYEATLERMAKEVAEGKMQRPEYLARLGALLYEFLERKDFWLAKIKQSNIEQAAIGEGAIKAAGCVEEDDYTIDESDGAVLRQRQDGEYVPVLARASA